MALVSTTDTPEIAEAALMKMSASVSAMATAAPPCVNVVAKPSPAPLASRSTPGAKLRVELSVGLLAFALSVTNQFSARSAAAPPLVGSAAVLL